MHALDPKPLGCEACALPLCYYHCPKVSSKLGPRQAQTSVEFDYILTSAFLKTYNHKATKNARAKTKNMLVIIN